jgi:multiple sugar transport system ATP-binding protein
VDRSHDETFVVEVDGQRPISEGQRLYANVPSEDVHLFDRQTGETIHQRRLDREGDLSLSAGTQTAPSSSD